ncbi:RusA family crossover junction endodeoxyribonuclease [Gulosibacter faecalis]|uniref:RusA family crossover junction endodeoxyribonuclease n=1 Tax=Gulosibacter faecalis TaxID=272240 RepID=A0ABW5UTV4_9MICO|nr:RusA family crossover junction endodeoxyribonuclease [Gulosibacter faecalis]
MSIDFTVEGVPAPQGSKNAFVTQKQGERPRAVVVDKNPDALKAWREQVRVAARATGARIERGVPVRVDLIFWMPRGKTVKRELPTVKPDLDKLTRAIGDALTDSWLIADDSQIVTSTQTKKYATETEPAGVRIRVTQLEGN